MERGWSGLPFRPISQYYKSRFGSKVYKIPVAIAEDCPNRRGLKGMKTCLFCDQWGSAAKAESLTMALRDQIEHFHARISKKYHSENFLIYFQAYTSTFTQLAQLKQHFEVGLQYPFVKGFVVGTRPDCISSGVIDLWNDVHANSYVSVEMGVQSFDDQQLLFMQRGHTRKQSLDAIHRIHNRSPVDLGIHLIFGWPNETDQDVIEAARICNDLPIQNVKLHNLHVLKDTGLEKLYAQGLFSPIEFETYARRVQLFLEHLSPRIYIHRLAAYASRWDELIAPAWTADKMKTHQGLVDWLRFNHSFQSRGFIAVSTEDQCLRSQLQQQALALPEAP